MKNFLFLFLSLGILFTSCKKDPAAIQMDNAVQHIPSDATQVSVIRLPQLMEKADFNAIKEMDFYQEMIEQVGQKSKLASEVMYSPEKSGINMEENAYFFVDVNPMNPNQTTAGLLLNMADKAKLEKMVSDVSTDNIEVADGYQYIQNDDAFISWNDEIVFLGGGKKSNKSAMLSRVFNMTEGGSILSSSAFEKIGGSQDDVSFMVNMDPLLESNEAKQALAMVGWSEKDLDGNQITGNLNFEDKKMVSTTHFDLSKNIATDLGMPFKSMVSTDFSDYLPSENLTSAFTFGLDTKGLLQLLKEKGLMSAINMTTNIDQLGITPEQIADAIDGDMALALQSAGADGKPAGIFCMSIDEKAFQPLLEFMINANFISGSNGVYTITDEGVNRDFDQSMGGDGNPNPAQIIVKDDKLFVSADPALLEGAKTGGLPKGKRIDKKLYKNISKGFLGGKGFPEKLKNLMPNDVPQDGEIESFVFYVEDGFSKLEMVSKEEGNFLKSMIENQAKKAQ